LGEAPFDITAMQTMATSLNELFGSLTESGFTEDQALTLLAKWLAESGKTHE
jgi:hypothetical protein